MNIQDAIRQASTVGEVIEALEKLPQDLPCLVRPKYHGQMKAYEEAPVCVNGISEMHPNDAPKNVTFLV
jgi:hypothetical protein